MAISVENFERLYEHYSPMVHRVCRIVLREHPELDPQDPAQIVFLKIYLHFDSFCGNSSLGTWVYSIATNAAHDVLRKKRKHRFTVPLDELQEEQTPYVFLTPSPETEMIQAQALENARTRLRRLRPDDFNILYLRHVEELDINEIGSLLGLKENTVKTRLSRARQRAVKILQKPPSISLI